MLGKNGHYISYKIPSQNLLEKTDFKKMHKMCQDN